MTLLSALVLTALAIAALPASAPNDPVALSGVAGDGKSPATALDVLGPAPAADAAAVSPAA